MYIHQRDQQPDRKSIQSLYDIAVIDAEQESGGNDTKGLPPAGAPQPVIQQKPENHCWQEAVCHF